jgi:hypothetical protein
MAKRQIPNTRSNAASSSTAARRSASQPSKMPSQTQLDEMWDYWG